MVIAPIWVSSSSGSPTRIFANFSCTICAKSSATDRSTISREPETQHCPVLKPMPKATPSAASSSSASAKTICEFLPPSSSPSFLKFVRPAACTTARPTRVEPVKDSMSMS